MLEEIYLIKLKQLVWIIYLSTSMSRGLNSEFSDDWNESNEDWGFGETERVNPSLLLFFERSDWEPGRRRVGDLHRGWLYFACGADCDRLKDLEFDSKEFPFSSIVGDNLDDVE